MEGHWDRLWTGLKAQDPPTKLQPEAWSLSVGIMFRVIVPQSLLTSSVHCMYPRAWVLQVGASFRGWAALGYLPHPWLHAHHPLRRQ